MKLSRADCASTMALRRVCLSSNLQLFEAKCLSVLGWSVHTVSSFSFKGLADLLARHYRCLFAGGCDDFTHHSTVKEIASILNHRLPTLLDVLLFICISFLLSLTPLDQSFDTPNSASAVSANAHVRLIAAEVLQLITGVS